MLPLAAFFIDWQTALGSKIRYIEVDRLTKREIIWRTLGMDKMSSPTGTNRSPLGRKPKFKEPSSSITITLPDRILKQLQTIDADRAKAIVKCVDNTLGMKPRHNNIEIIQISEKEGVMVVGPCKVLESVPWIKLIEIAPCRYLVSQPIGTSIESLEIALIDILERMPEEPSEEREMLKSIRHQIKQQRENEAIHTREILLMNMP